MKASLYMALTLALLVAGCGQRPVEVDHPFYLSFIEDPHEVALFRCSNSPDDGCAIDGLPGPRVIAAGANKRFLAVAQEPTSGGEARYYYFARVPEETFGWGNNPEKIIGPLTAEEFAQTKATLSLPELTVWP